MNKNFFIGYLKLSHIDLAYKREPSLSLKSKRLEQNSFFNLILVDDEAENPVEIGKSFAKEDTEGKLF